LKSYKKGKREKSISPTFLSLPGIRMFLGVINRIYTQKQETQLIYILQAPFSLSRLTKGAGFINIKEKPNLRSTNAQIMGSLAIEVYKRE